MNKVSDMNAYTDETMRMSDDHEKSSSNETSNEILDSDSNIVATMAAVGLVGAGVVIFEAALLPGVVLGVAAMAAPQILPRLGVVANPILKSTVRGFYKASRKTKEFVAETQEQVQDIVAEIEQEDESTNLNDDKNHKA